MNRARESALEARVNKLNAVVSEQADYINELKALVADLWNTYREVYCFDICKHETIDCHYPENPCYYEEKFKEFGIIYE